METFQLPGESTNPQRERVIAMSNLSLDTVVKRRC